MLLCCLIHAAIAAPTLDFASPGTRSGPVRFGVIAGPTGGAVDLTSQFQAFGIRYVRNNDYFDDRLDMEGILNCEGVTYPSWSGCDASEERYYHWEASDALMNTFRSGGFEPMLRLGGEWQNRGRKHDFKGPRDGLEEANWVTAATRVALRYRHRYVYLDIWTEFPGPHFWDRDAPSFAAFWVKAYRAVKAAVPEARVGGPGFAMMATKAVLAGGRQQVARQFLATLYSEGVKPDWIGWHLFSSDPAEFAAAGKAYRRLLDGTGEFSDVPWAGSRHFAGVELVLDAFGHGRKSNGEDLPESVQQELGSGARGAASLAASLISLSESDTTRAYYYRANDPGAAGGRGTGGSEARGGPPGGRGGGRRGELAGGGGGGPGGGGAGAGGGDDEGWLGLFGRDGAAKLPAHAVRLWVRFGDEFPTPTGVSDPGVSGVWAASAQGAAGRAIYLSNYSERAAVVTLGGAGTAWLLDDTHDGTQAEALPSGPLHLAPWEVALVVIPR